ncbi:hypothetical protein H7672_09995 [Streptococcus dysgalactiae subsp. equisimilis]|uniref:hypothetical protein n=1 Tax=Streptococcus dysgalactiae TaxID=1334 RepID=UPI00194FBB9A|nr:hypothetical protein [Streptococcus dysgalactiae]MBM6514921.1 hypothetical protein [Streptococcus dysgalactiae subsp. equisimilis]
MKLKLHTRGGNTITIQGDRTLYDELVKYLLSGEQPNWVASPRQTHEETFVFRKLDS